MNKRVLTTHYGFPDQMVNLQGMHLKSLTSDWWPYNFRVGCKSGQKNCRWKGFLVDYINEASKLMNFTWSCEYSTSWGSLIPSENKTQSGNLQTKIDLYLLLGTL